MRGSTHTLPGTSRWPRCIEQLRGLIGDDAGESLPALGARLLPRLGLQRDALRLRFILRRRAVAPEASGGGGGTERIGFHRDSSLVVVNVAPNEGFEGARLLFALNGRIVCPARPPGCATAHDHTMVHGVSCLASGVRYNLFAVFDAQPLASALA